MSEQGWFPSWRKMYDSGHWLAPSVRDPSNRRDAWNDLCQMATHTERETAFSRVLERGEFVASMRTLAKRWGWSKSKVARFLCDLENRTAIGTVRGTPDGTVYRIVNYDTYAVGYSPDRDTERDRERDDRGTEARQEQSLEHVKNTDRGVPKKAARLPGDWAPTTEHIERAKESGIDVLREADKFRAHAEENDRKAKVWNAAFTRWLINAEEYANKSNGRGAATDDRRNRSTGGLPMRRL